MEGIKHLLAPNMGPLTKKVQPLADKMQGGEDQGAGGEHTKSKSTVSISPVRQWGEDQGWRRKCKQ